jgi:hypothetical protein
LIYTAKEEKIDKEMNVKRERKSEATAEARKETGSDANGVFGENVGAVEHIGNLGEAVGFALGGQQVL